MKEDIERFLTYLSVEKGFSGNTLSAYLNDLSQLASFVEGDASQRGLMPSWTNLSRQQILSYLLSLNEKSYAATTKARKIAAAKSFFKFMVCN